MIPAPPSSASNSSTTPEADNIAAATLKLWPSIKALVMLRPRGGRVSEAIKFKSYGTRRESTARIVMLYGSVLIRDKTVAFEGEKVTGDWIEMELVNGLRVMLTAPKLERARPVVWRRVVTSTPDGGIWRRSVQEK